MSISVNASNPVLAALQDLNGGGQSAADAALVGGRPASTPSSDSAVSIGQNGSLDLSALDAESASLGRASSIADLAAGAGKTVASLLANLKDQAVAAQDPSLDTAARQTLDSNFKTLLGQIASTVSQASFDGVNLLDGATAGLTTTAAGGSLSLTAQDLSLGGPVVTVSAASNLGTPTAAASALADVSDSLANIQTALDALSAQAGKISAHGSILAAAVASDDGSGADGARLLALQIQQQLAAQPQPIANQSPQLVLSLFR